MSKACLSMVYISQPIGVVLQHQLGEKLISSTNELKLVECLVV